jgi:sensor domain CHASE-containing protein
VESFLTWIGASIGIVVAVYLWAQASARLDESRRTKLIEDIDRVIEKHTSSLAEEIRLLRNDRSNRL